MTKKIESISFGIFRMYEDQPLPRVILIGDSFCGKTALLMKLMGQKLQNYEPTIGASNFIYSRNVKGKNLKIQIWDTAGQEQYQSLGPIYYRNACAAIFVYDVTKIQTFNHIPQWHKIFMDSVGGKFNPILFLVGNKIDLQDEIAIDEASASSFATDNGFFFFQTSALEGHNVERLFQSVIEKIYTQAPKETETKEVKEQSSKCC